MHGTDQDGHLWGGERGRGGGSLTKWHKVMMIIHTNTYMHRCICQCIHVYARERRKDWLGLGARSITGSSVCRRRSVSVTAQKLLKKNEDAHESRSHGHVPVETWRLGMAPIGSNRRGAVPGTLPGRCPSKQPVPLPTWNSGEGRVELLTGRALIWQWLSGMWKEWRTKGQICKTSSTTQT